MAKEVAVAAETASYERRVQETEIRLADELAEVYKDYCKEVWVEALNWAGVFTTSEWKSVENIFYPEDIREIPAMLRPPTALTLPPPEQPSTTQAPLPSTEASKGAGKTGDQA